MHAWVQTETSLKTSLLQHPLRHTLYDVLGDIKAKSTIHHAHTCNDYLMNEYSAPVDAQMMRLDNMLAAEGITTTSRNPDANAVAVHAISAVATTAAADDSSSFADSNAVEHADYQLKLAEIRRSYTEQYEKYANICKDFTKNVSDRLLEQSKVRPISQHERTRLLRAIERKFLAIPMQLKQNVCEAVMMERSK